MYSPMDIDPERLKRIEQNSAVILNLALEACGRLIEGGFLECSYIQKSVRLDDMVRDLIDSHCVISENVSATTQEVGWLSNMVVALLGCMNSQQAEILEKDIH